MMPRIPVEFPPHEALALLNLTAGGSLSPIEIRDAHAARARLAQAVHIEQNSGGSLAGPPDVEAAAEALIGERVHVTTTYGTEITGTLRRVSGFRSIVVDEGPFSRPVNLSLVKSIEPVREGAAA